MRTAGADIGDEAESEGRGGEREVVGNEEEEEEGDRVSERRARATGPVGTPVVRTATRGNEGQQQPSKHHVSQCITLGRWSGTRGEVDEEARTCSGDRDKGRSAST